jgi:hypothetical protein
MKVNGSVLILVLSMHTVNMFIMLHDLDIAYQLMAEQIRPDKTPDEMDNGDASDDDHLRRDQKEVLPTPYLIGWEWLTG